MTKLVETDRPQAEVEEGRAGVLPGSEPVWGAEADKEKKASKETKQTTPFQEF